jgi:tetratricopeptide (TPR) repeat protein
VKKIAVYFFCFVSFLYADVSKNKVHKYSLAEILLKAKNTKDIKLKKKYLRLSFEIKPSMYALKMLLEINKNNPKKYLNIIEYGYDIFPLNKFLTLKGTEIALKNGMYDKAEFFIFSYLQKYPLDKDVLMFLGKYYEKKGKIENALRVYKTVNRLYNDKQSLSEIKKINNVFN